MSHSPNGDMATYQAKLSAVWNLERTLNRESLEHNRTLRFATSTNWTNDQWGRWRLLQVPCQKLAKRLGRNFHADLTKLRQGGEV